MNIPRLASSREVDPFIATRRFGRDLEHTCLMMSRQVVYLAWAQISIQGFLQLNAGEFSKSQIRQCMLHQPCDLLTKASVLVRMPTKSSTVGERLVYSGGLIMCLDDLHVPSLTCAHRAAQCPSTAFITFEFCELVPLLRESATS